MFSQLEELSNHLQLDERYQGSIQHCTYCNLCFYSTKVYQNHIFAKHSENRNQCPICGVGVKHTCNFRRHVLSHFVEKPYSCDKCGCCFTRKDSLKKHLKKLHFSKKDKSYRRISVEKCRISKDDWEKRYRSAPFKENEVKFNLYNLFS